LYMYTSLYSLWSITPSWRSWFAHSTQKRSSRTKRYPILYRHSPSPIGSGTQTTFYPNPTVSH
jgi:hypothetical protein